MGSPGEKEGASARDAGTHNEHNTQPASTAQQEEEEETYYNHALEKAALLNPRCYPKGQLSYRVGSTSPGSQDVYYMVTLARPDHLAGARCECKAARRGHPSCVHRATALIYQRQLDRKRREKAANNPLLRDQRQAPTGAKKENSKIRRMCANPPCQNLAERGNLCQDCYNSWAEYAYRYDAFAARSGRWA